MPMKKTARASLHHLTLAVMFTLLLSNTGFSQGGAAIPLPPGSWAVRCSAFRTAGYESLPVMVTAVTSDVDRGIEVTNVSVVNRTPQKLTAVRLSWYLSTQDDPASVLQQGRTKLLNLKRAGGIDPGENREVTFPVVSFAAIYRPLLQGGELRGKYLIQVAVSEARFEDGSSQILLTSNARLKRAATFSSVSYRAAGGAQTFCPNQTCSVVRDGGTGTVLGYSCVPSVGEVCSVGSTGKSCTSTLCGQTGGGGGRPPIEP